jgi:Tfp pilus assembly protein PilO
METANTPTTPIKKEKKNSKIIWIIIAAVAVIAVAWFAWNNSSIKAEYDQLATEKAEMKAALESELDSLMTEHTLIKEQYGELSDSLMLKDSLIVANAKEIKDLLNFKWEYYKVKKKLDKLRVVAKTYVHQMDSLYTVNNELVEENKEIKQKYNEEKAITKNLKKEKAQLSEKIGEASVLKAYNTQARAYYTKRSGTEKEVDRARRTSIIEVCFTIGKNVVVEPGPKDVYVRIARPDNKILTPGVAEEYVFDYKGEKIQYSIFEKVEYDNDARPVCLRWVKKYEDVEMQEGVYEITIFASGEEIGTTKLELR